MFRYFRYNPVTLLRPALKRDARSPESVADVEPQMLRRPIRLGTLDPETSQIVWRDEATEGVPTDELPLSLATDDLAPL